MHPDRPFEILVVDDEPPIYEMLTLIARKVFPEATFSSASSAQETLLKIDESMARLPQLVLLDIDLRQSVSGLDLLPELKNKLRGQVPIIIFSASGDPSTVQQSYTQGAVAYTKKPDDLQGWRDYLTSLRGYWYDTTRLPTDEDR